MKLRLAFGIGVLALSSHAQAACGSGFYAGPFIGMGIADGEISTRQQTLPGINPLMRDNKIGNHSFLGGGVIGYTYQKGSYHAGIEVLGNLDTFDKKVLNEDSGGVVESFNLKRKHQFGFAVRLGYGRVSGSVFYLRLGGEWSAHQLDYALHSTDVPGATTTHHKKSKTLFHFVPGVGVEIPMSRQWRVRLEGKYALARKVKMQIPGIGGGATFSDTHVRVKPSQASVILGATYHFN